MSTSRHTQLRRLCAGLASLSLLALSGCVAYPASGYYYGGPGYAYAPGPYYYGGGYYGYGWGHHWH